MMSCWMILRVVGQVHVLIIRVHKGIWIGGFTVFLGGGGGQELVTETPGENRDGAGGAGGGGRNGVGHGLEWEGKTTTQGNSRRTSSGCLTACSTCFCGGVSARWDAKPFLSELHAVQSWILYGSVPNLLGDLFVHGLFRTFYSFLCSLWAAK